MLDRQKKWLKNTAVFLWKDKENLLFAVWFLWMAVYYGVRMFRITPWYDELYTYYYFISRGPVYAATHWPLPNNHVGYSVLSACLDLAGSSTIGLRGISYISSLGSLLLLYRICRKSFAAGWSLCCVTFYSCMNLVNLLAVQGRGYALASFCLLAALYALQNICLWREGKGRRRDYILFSVSLLSGLYTIPSSIYWVLPLCLTGGIFFLLHRRTGRLIRLVLSALAAALGTCVLYMIIWLAIGSNLLSKTEGGAYYGLGHVRIILSAPVMAARTGIDYMLATPYIQGVERAGFLSEFGKWLRALLDYYYTGMWAVLACTIAGGLVLLLVSICKSCREGKSGEILLPLFTAVFMAVTPLMLIIQCTLPYYRVFSYMGIPIALLLAMLLQNSIKKRLPVMLPAAVALGIAIVLLLSESYNREYGMSEYYAKDALKHAELSNVKNLCVTDCYEQYILKYYWGIECESTQIEDADYVLLHRDMSDAGYEGFRWESYCTWQDIPWDYMEERMIPVYSNEEYELYRKK